MNTDHTEPTAEPTLVRITRRTVSVAEFSDGQTPGLLVEPMPEDRADPAAEPGRLRMAEMQVPSVADAAARTMEYQEQVHRLIGDLRSLLGEHYFLALDDAVNDYATAIRIEAAARLGAAASAMMEDGFDRLVFAPFGDGADDI